MRYKTLELENEYLKVVVLPELGGHLYTCIDKSNGAEMFYANQSIRKAQIGYRGAWAAYGIEFNFPVSHNWVSMSPGGLRDREEPRRQRVDLGGQRGSRLRHAVAGGAAPGARAARSSSSTSPSTTRSAVRHRFYWWNNAAVRVHDDSRIHYPMRWTASHGFAEVDTWPVNQAGRDLSLVGQPHRRPRVASSATAAARPSWASTTPGRRPASCTTRRPRTRPPRRSGRSGGDADGIDWRRALSDDKSAYVEVQAGLFRNQETYGFLEPQETIRFTEYWMPVRAIGGITRANPEAVVNVERKAGKAGTVDLSRGRQRQPRGARRPAARPGRSARRARGAARPDAGAVARAREGRPALGAALHRSRSSDGGGRVLLTHTEDAWDYAQGVGDPAGPAAVARGRRRPTSAPTATS